LIVAVTSIHSLEPLFNFYIRLLELVYRAWG